MPAPLAALLEHARGREVLSALVSWWLAGAPATDQSLRKVMTKIEQEDAPVKSLLDAVLELGEARGLRSSLAALLRAKFGEVDPPLLARIEDAEVATLQQWMLRVLTADRVDDVFA